MNFKTFLTVLKRNKLYTFINLFGLSLSLAFVILLGLYIQKETSVDEQHVNGDRIYRLQTTESVTLPPRLVTDLKSRYPEIEMSTRMMRRDIWCKEPPRRERRSQSVKPLIVELAKGRSLYPSFIYVNVPTRVVGFEYEFRLNLT